ncbi:GIY-YIG nuclease family protein [Sphingobium yanoikuyae]|uniref:GIY-YIG nuclease family protein n=1 Tax=Sphingobium yanoikuyae TaxID=13690 RepID=UPI003F018C99
MQNQIPAGSDVNRKGGFRHRLSDEQLTLARKRCKSVPRTSYIRQVYFAAAPGGPIKIGMACDTERRVRELRKETKTDIRLLAETSGGSFIESMYHRRFADARIHGEWFARTPAILAEIDRLNANPPADLGRGV